MEQRDELVLSNPDFVAVESEAATAKGWLALTIQNAVEMDKAAEGISAVRGLLKRYEAIRKEIVKPLSDHVKKLNDIFKARSSPLEEVEKHLVSEMGNYRAEIERKRVEEERRLQKLNEARTARAEAAGRPVPVPVEIKPAMVAPQKIEVAGGQSVRFMKVAKWELQDASKVPAEYLCLDEAKIGKVVKAGVREIPGLRIWEVDVPVVR